MTSILPDLPVSLATDEKSVQLYKVDCQIYVPLQVEPDQGMTINYLLKSEEGKRLIEEFKKLVSEKNDIVNKSVLDAKAQCEEIIRAEQAFWQKTGYLYQEVGRLLSQFARQDKYFAGVIKMSGALPR